MPHAVFTPLSSAAIRAALFSTGLIIAAIPAALVFAMRQPPVTGVAQVIEQPVAFDHRHHVRDLGIDCRYCHDQVELGAHAGVPPTARCMNCHNQVWTTAALLAPVRWSMDAQKPIVWQQVHRLPDFVYFDHAVHIHKGVGCVTCHGHIDTMAHVYQVEPMTMNWCVDCHRHPESALRPRDHITDMDWSPSREEQERIGRDIAISLTVAPTLDCSGCHR